MAATKQAGAIILMPCREGVCPECATDHEFWEPHNLSLYYQYHFYADHRRFPTWADAMAHCTDEVQVTTRKVLEEHGIIVEKETAKRGCQ